MSLSRISVLYCRSSRFIRQISTQISNNVTHETLSGDFKGVAVISLNKQEKKNALSKTFVSDLIKACEKASADAETRVLILRSKVPGIFCAGADLKERLKMPENEVAPFVATIRSLVKDLIHFPVPTIAAIDGAALGGGLEIALGCDIRTVAGNAKLGLPETRLAILPGAGGTQTLQRLVGPSLAKELIFTGRVMDGREATELGIANHVVEQNSEDDAAFQKALAIAAQILPQGPIGIKNAKLAINEGGQVDIDTGLKFEEAYYSRVIPTADRIEGLRAFSEKRKPIYEGR